MLLFQFILFQVVAFGVVIYFLKKIFYGDTESAIKRLGHVYQDLLQKQADLQKKNEESEAEVKAKREEAGTLVEKMKTEAAVETRKKEDDVLKSARAEAEEIIAKAQASREDMAKEIQSQLSKQMVGFAQQVSAKALGDKLAVVVHEELVQQFVAKAKNMEFSNAGGGTVEEFIVRTPIPLKKEETEKLNALLASKLSRAVKFNEVVDVDLVAGVVLQFGTLILDGSLVSLLKESADRVRDTY